MPLVAAIFFMVSGGPYGLEPVVEHAGYLGALLVIALTPLLWSLPTALMVGELAAAIPEEGGYYIWVRRALGPFWGFQEAWWSLAASVFDMALYPTLCVAYLAHLWPELGQATVGLPFGAALIGGCVLLNLRGARAVGVGSLAMALVIHAPFVVLCCLALLRRHPLPTDPSPTFTRDLAAGLLVAMWNFMGWDNASTVAGEVENPQRTYPRALLLTVGLVTAGYALPVLAAFYGGVDRSLLSTGGWVVAANRIGGNWLGSAVALGGAISGFGMFNALLLSYSRLPLALARDGFLPTVFAETRGQAEVPVVCLLVAGCLYTLCLSLGFERLVLFDVLLYGLALLLDFAALVALRVREPDLERPFRIPLGARGLVVLSVFPLVLLIAAAYAAQRELTWSMGVGAALILGTGPLVYDLGRRRRLRLTHREAGTAPSVTTPSRTKAEPSR
jgi:amino acid transporter